MPDPELAGLSVLIVEDESLLRKRLGAQLERAGADVTTAESIATATRFLDELGFDFVILDVHLPDGSGLDLLRSKRIPVGSGVIVMTGDGGVGGAVEAMKLGALDYLVKPFEPGELALIVARASRTRRVARLEEHRRNDTTEAVDDFFFGSSLAGLQAQLKKILAADERMQTLLPPILIHGETGTGKTTVARWLHHRGPRAAQPLVEMNCSSVPEALAESELFGHERGAFTDARASRIGLFEAANGGTLFLDELPSLSLGVQAKVLKTLEDHRIRRLGGNKEIPVDVRVIAATHQDLQKQILAGHFREDLYHRLDLYRVNLLPLRERGGDIAKLAEQLAAHLFRRHRLKPKKISALGVQRLQSYPWPGNVRELAHELERAIVFDESETLDFENLRRSPSLGAASPESAIAEGAGGFGAGDWFRPGFVFPPSGFSLEGAIDRLIQCALKQSGNNVSAAARLLGVSRDYVRYRNPKTKDRTGD